MPTIVSVDDSTVPGEGSSRLLLLVSSDNKHIVVEEDIMSRSRFISKQVEGFEATSQRHAILLPFSSFVLNKVIEYCSHYRGYYLLEDDPDAAPPGRSPVREWDQEFLDVDRNMLLRIIKAAHYLEIKSLVGSCARAIADMIRGKTTEEMREILGVENDFTPEEEHSPSSKCTG
ncbi:putative E3 ubiquitin ligase complex SCF subunit sconC [Artomyces pyxidatus]|uniref:E3 ubiquitin ligase complex SCF subunit sconC n=1 Tax=Artomyces pyxidatus TaxID=48021 RepID=A0ACB8TCD4_9AGAM|nr:putative E3 ubiquitin ligase complex SCF subunit sconC [Artomyces pyxidatus]